MEETNAVLENTDDYITWLNNNSKTLNSPVGISIMHINIRSLRKHWDHLNIYLKSLKFEIDVILLTEININCNEAELYNINGFSSYCINRTITKRGGGIMAFVKDNLQASVTNKKLGTNDMMQLTINHDKQRFTILCVYRQPNTSVPMFSNELKTELMNSRDDHNVILLGDINIDLLSKNNGYADQYETLMAYQGFEKKINTVTREEIRNSMITGTCIDHIYCKTKEYHTEAAVLKHKIADHYSTHICLFNKTAAFVEQSDKVLTSEITFYNDKEIVKQLMAVKWDDLSDNLNAEQMYNVFLDRVQEIYEKNKKVQLSNKSSKRNCTNNWISNELLKKIKIKNEMWKKIAKNKNKVDQEKVDEYKKFKNKLQNEIKRAKQTFFKEKIETGSGNPKLMWNQVNEILGKKSKENIDI